jgi:hypothetical protein
MSISVLPTMPNRSLTTSAASVLLLLSLAAAGCEGGGGGGSGGNGDVPDPDPGESSGTLEVSATVSAVYTVASGGAASVALLVDVEYDDGSGTQEDVNDAIVEIGPPGELPLVLSSTGNGSYAGTATAYSAVWELSVERGTDYLRDAVLVGSPDFSVTVEPDPPEIDQAASITWSPVDGDAFKTVQILNFTSAQFSYEGDTVADDGVEAVPDTTFPDVGLYRVEVTRSTRLVLDGSTSTSLVLLRRRKNVDVTP